MQERPNAPLLLAIECEAKQAALLAQHHVLHAHHKQVALDLLLDLTL
jgi:hypothetical protein